MSFVTKGVLQNLNPALWREHRFGIPRERWESLRGASFWVTGAGTGYGQCISLALAAAGAHVFMTGRRLDMLEGTREQAVRMGVAADRFHLLAADITAETELAAAERRIADLGVPLGGVVHCAAVPQAPTPVFPLCDIGEEALSAMWAINVMGQLRVSRIALASKSVGERFRMIFLSSEAGWASTEGFGPYNVSKAGVNSLGMSLATECKAKFPNRDFQINVLVPGEAKTEMNQGSTQSPYAVVCMTLALLSHPRGGPNGCFFHRDGRHLQFAYAAPFTSDLLLAR